MRIYHLFKSLFLTAALAAAVTSCGDKEEDDFVLGKDDKTSGTTDKNQGVNTPPSAYTLRLEVPKLSDKGIFVQHSTAYKGDSVMTYCLEYDASAMHTRWIAFRFDGLTSASNVGRSDEPFVDDPDLPTACRIGSNGFGNQYYDLDGKYQTLSSGQFDRGHLCASADRYMSREANEQTFYMSNMSPQMSKFNSPYWSSYENWVQKKGRTSSFADTLYVVKGGTIAQGQTLGFVVRNNNAKVTIPAYYFMALLKCKNGTYEAMAFWMEHKIYGKYTETSAPNSELAAHAITIDDLEEKTGIDFFHNLPDDIEKSVEAKYTASAWGF